MMRLVVIESPHIAYALKNTVNGKRYIGITRRPLMKRWCDHKSRARRRADTPLYRGIRKYGEDNWEVVALASARSYEALLELEVLLIRQERTLVSQGGYNVTFGGDGTPGWVPSEETKKKIAEASRRQMANPAAREHLAALAKVQWRDPVLRAAQSMRHKGKTITAEQRAQISLRHRGRMVSDETRTKLGALFRGKPRPPEIAARLRTMMLGRNHTDETRAKMSKQRRGVPRAQRCDARVITANGESLSPIRWARKLGISQQSMYQRLAKWSEFDAVTTPRGCKPGGVS